MSILNFFPVGYQPTSLQSKTLNKIEAAFKNNHTVILNAPTGSGKSFFASTLAKSSREIDEYKYENINSYRAFMVDQTGQYIHTEHDQAHGAVSLTITKALQDQYVALFECDTLKGKSNYTSTIDPSMDVEIESAVIPRHILSQHRESGKCPYHNDRNKLLTSQYGVTNYKMYMQLPPHVKQRQYLICDEASELEDDIVSHNTCVIDYDVSKRCGVSLPILKSSEPLAVYSWLDDVNNILHDHRMYLQQQLRKKSKWTGKTQSKYTYINRLLAKVRLCTDNFYNCEYIVEKNNTTVRLTPLHIDTLTNQLFDNGEKILLMSATIVDHKNFAKSLGITNYKYIEIPSEFPPEKSPIYVSSKYPLSRNTIDKFLPKIVDNINEIISHHDGEKGVIHTHSHHITQFIYEKLQCDRLVYREPGVTNEDIINIHKQSDEPTILMSPSLTHGVDLKDDLARFQIVVKLPYLPFNDKRVKTILEADPDWYENKMLNILVQSCGRCTRSKDDYSTTYILDGMISRVLPKCKEKLPGWFLQRFV